MTEKQQSYDSRVTTRVKRKTRRWGRISRGVPGQPRRLDTAGLSIKQWGNSTGMIIPASTQEQPYLLIGQVLVAEIRADALVFKSARPKYPLAELIEKCDPRAKSAADVAIWQDINPKGNEVW